MIHQAAEVVEFVVSSESAGERVDRLLAVQMSNMSRSALKRLIEDGCLKSQDRGRTVKEPSFRVKAGERLVLTIPPPDDPELAAEDIPLVILHEDEHLIVVNKPAGLVVHPAPGNPRGTLVNALIAHCGDSLKGIGGVRRPGVVHRLDKDTSGVMVAAKTAAAHEGLTDQFAARSIHRIYAAYVWGIPFPPTGEIEGRIGRSRRDRKKMAVLRSGGRAALTCYLTRSVFGHSAARLECRLATGRTHQIRVHLAHRGHPVIGDPVYGGGATRARKQALDSSASALVTEFPRQALHAESLGFIHPETGQELVFKCDLPPDMQALEESLRGTGNS